MTKLRCALAVVTAASSLGLAACSSKSDGSAHGAGSGGAGGRDAGPPPGSPNCGTLAPVDDYAAPGPFPNTTTTDGSGPDGQYTVIMPATLGENGFKHPIITWGNGILTTPALYPGLLSGIASHGFVIIASDSTQVTADLMTAGLDWLIQQNAAGGQFEGKLNTDCAATVGYSLGGGAAVNAGNHAGVLATVSFHGLQGAAASLNGPLLLFTSTADGFVTKSGYVQPNYDGSTKVPTILATLDVPDASATFAGHLYPLGDAGEERAPAIAWLRLWVYGDRGAKKYFYGDDCLLCESPWTDIQRKNATW